MAVKDSKKELESCKKERDEYLNNWKRAVADFINYKNEEIERRGDVINMIKEDFFYKLLPIMDNIELAEKNIKDDMKDDGNIRGFLLIKMQIKDLLKSYDIQEIECDKFDPNFHEVVEEIDGGESGMIAEVVQKGYRIKNKVLRPAKVKVYHS